MDFIFLTDGVSHKQIFDKSVLVKQLHVVEAHGILLFRADKGKILRHYINIYAFLTIQGLSDCGVKWMTCLSTNFSKEVTGMYLSS